MNLKEDARPGCAEFSSNNNAEAMGDKDLDRVKKIQNQLGLVSQLRGRECHVSEDTLRRVTFLPILPCFPSDSY